MQWPEREYPGPLGPGQYLLALTYLLAGSCLAALRSPSPARVKRGRPECLALGHFIGYPWTTQDRVTSHEVPASARLGDMTEVASWRTALNQRIVLKSLAVIGCAAGIQLAAAAPSPPTDLAQLQQGLAALPVPFVSNAGQWDARTAFAAHTFAGTLLVTTAGQLVYNLPGREIDDPVAATPAADDANARRADPVDRALRSRAAARPRGRGGVLTETLVDGAGHALMLTPHGSSPQSGMVSYFLGDDPSRHRSGLATYERVSLGELSPGIALQLRATGSNVEKIFTVAPTRDPDAIRVRLGGADRLRLGPGGELIAHTALGPVVYTAPIAYPTAHNLRMRVAPAMVSSLA